MWCKESEAGVIGKVKLAFTGENGSGLADVAGLVLYSLLLNKSKPFLEVIPQDR